MSGKSALYESKMLPVAYLLCCLPLQTLVKGLMVQVKREKARLLMEIDEAMDRAFTILNRRYTTLQPPHTFLSLMG